jgi:G3E family GTPase
MSNIDDDDCPELVGAKVPVVVLTGFLGSGKTTLLQYILTQEHGLKIAVIVNEFEFGKSIEKGLTMRSSEKNDDEWLELNNGCLCCTAKTQTVMALESLIERKGSLDLILIETSGLADPAPIAATFWQDDALLSTVYLAGIIAVVDLLNIRDYLDKEHYHEALQQLLVADKIIYNKTDLVPTAEERERIVGRVKQINPVADFEFTSFSRIVNLRALLSMQTTTTDAVEYIATKRGLVEEVAKHHGHTTEITSVHFEITGAAAASKRSVDELLASVLYRDANDEDEDSVQNSQEMRDHGGAAAKPHAVGSSSEIVRLKAAVWIRQEGSDRPRLYQAQSIGELFDVVPMASEASVPFLTNRFLILGKRLQPAALQATLEAGFTPIHAPAS